MIPVVLSIISLFLGFAVWYISDRIADRFIGVKNNDNLFVGTQFQRTTPPVILESSGQIAEFFESHK